MSDLQDPAGSAIAVTKSNSASDNFPVPARGLYVGGTGDVIAVMDGDNANVTFSAVPAGTILPIRFKRIYSTGTTATLMVALF